MKVVALAICGATIVWSGINSTSELAAPSPALQQKRSSGVPWPPDPSNIVFVDSVNVSGADPGGTVEIEPGERLTVFNAPSDRWLVVTGLWLNASNAKGLSVEEQLLGENRIKIGGLFLGKTIVNQGSGRAFQEHAMAPLGIPFRPGSAVQIVSNLVSPSSQSISATFGFSGYLVAESYRGGEWPPHPRDIVFFDSSTLPEHLPFSGIQLSQGQLLDVLDLRPGKTMVLSGMWVQDASGMQLCEESAGLLSTRVSQTWFTVSTGPTFAIEDGFRAPLGVVFTKGSGMVFRHKFGSPPKNLAFGFVGYCVGKNPLEHQAQF